MPRFFVHPPISAAARSRLGALAVESGCWDFPIPKYFFDVDWSRVMEFLAESKQEDVQPLHDPDFVPPTPQPECRGSQVFGLELRERIAKRHTLGGEGALVVIVDGGVDAKRLKPHGVRFDTTSVRAPTSSTGLRLHGTMCALDAFLGAPKAQFADLTVSDNRDVVSTSVLAAFEGLLESAKDHSLVNYSACVVSVSLQLTSESATDDARLPDAVRLTGNRDHALWRVAGKLQEVGFDVVIAAGNDGCNPEAPYISGLALHPALLTVGAVDPGGRVERLSSRGQGAKPNFSTYTNFLWSDPESFDSGTSAATALAAGLLASLRTAHADRHRGKLPPVGLMNELKNRLQRPTHPVQGSEYLPNVHSHEYGWGIL